ncbi:MAG: WS/DGAT domain-containing protein [Burkholderiaceae bacterium]
MVQTQILEYLGNKGSAVMTNVPGPSEQIRMAGVPLSRVMVWVPQSGNIGIGVSILSYAGGVQFGVISDTALCPDPQAIIDGFAPEFERLVLALAMLPNGFLLGRELAPGELEHALLLEVA